jgi:hypothetical protein
MNGCAWLSSTLVTHRMRLSTPFVEFMLEDHHA